MSEDKKIQNLIINKLTKEQYKSLEEKAIDELYFVTDEEHFTTEEINELLAVKQDKLTAGDGIEILEDGTINNTRISAEWGNIQGDLSTQTDLQELVSTKVDKVDGKSLISDTEIERLSSVNNYDDAPVLSDISDLKINKQDKLTAGTGIEISEDNVISVTGAQGGSSTWGSIEGDISTQKDLQDELSTRGSKLEYKGSTLSLLNSNDEVLNSVNITSGGTGSVNIDNKTISYNDNNEIQSVGNYTLNNEFKNYWSGTLEEYNRDLESGLITEHTECHITDDEEIIFDTLLTATTNSKGVVQPDGKTIIIDENGIISAVGGGTTTEVNIATIDKAGIVKPDGTTITITEDGTISSIGGGSSNVEVDNKTISLNEENKIEAVGIHTLDGSYQNMWTGTLEEYNQAVLDGIITEDTLCNITDDTKDVVFPIAKDNELGVVKPDGETITVDENGTISANIPDVDTSNLANIDLSNITDLGLQNVLSTLANVSKTGSYNDLTDKPTIPNEYTLPTASTDVLGGVKVDGSTIAITDGIISAVAQSGPSDWEYSKTDADNWYLKHKSTGFIIQALSWSGNLTGVKTSHTNELYGNTYTTYDASTTKTLLTPFSKHAVYTQMYGRTKVYTYTQNSVTSYEGATVALSGLSTVKISISCFDSGAAKSRAYDAKFMAFGY